MVKQGLSSVASGQRGIITKPFGAGQGIVQPEVEVDFYDLNGSIDNGEFCYRELVWRHVVLATGNAIHLGDGIYEHRQIPKIMGASHVRDLKTLRNYAGENVKIVDWPERWLGEVEDNWSGRGVEFVHQWLKDRDMIPANSEFTDLSRMERFVTWRFEEQITAGRFKRRNGITEMFQLRAAQGRQRAIVTNDHRDLMERKLKSLQISVHHDEKMPFNVQMTVTPDLVGGKKKSAPDMYVYAIREMSRRNDGARILANIIEDTPGGIISAHDAAAIVAEEGHLIRAIIHYPYNDFEPVSPQANFRIVAPPPQDAMAELPTEFRKRLLAVDEAAIRGGGELVSPEDFMQQLLAIDATLQSTTANALVRGKGTPRKSGIEARMK